MRGVGIQRPSSYYSADVNAIEEAKILIRGGDFKSAIGKVKEAIGLHTRIPNVEQMLTVSEILHKSQTFKPSPHLETWPYDLLQLPSSSTQSEVKSRYRELMNDLNILQRKFPSVCDAIRFLHETMSFYNRKRKLVLSDDEDEDNHDIVAAVTDGTGGDDSDGEEDPFASRSPAFKKLRKQIFTTFPQNPHFSPLSKYSAGVREEMKVGFDVVFVKLTQRIQNLGDTLSHEDEIGIRGELLNLEEMGYHVKKLRERFDLLVRLVKEHQELEKQLEAETADEMVQLGVIQSRISELEKEKESSNTHRIKLKSEIDALKSKVDKQGDFCNMLEKFKSTGMEIWK